MSQGFSGVGLVTFHTRTGSGGKGNGVFLGNCPKLSIKMEPKTVERNESMTTSRSPLRRMTQSTAASIEIVTDEFNKHNVSRALGARLDAIASGAATINETFQTGAILGTVLATSYRNINTLVVTDSTGSPKTLVKDVNYTEDLFAGHIALIDVTTGGPFVEPYKASFKKGAVAVVSAMTKLQDEIWVSLAGTNADNGARGVLDAFRVRLDVAQVVEFLNTEYNDFTLTGSVLQDQTKSASATGGQIFQFVMPSTAEFGGYGWPDEAA